MANGKDDNDIDKKDSDESSNKDTESKDNKSSDDTSSDSAVDRIGQHDNDSSTGGNSNISEPQNHKSDNTNNTNTSDDKDKGTDNKGNDSDSAGGGENSKTTGSDGKDNDSTSVSGGEGSKEKDNESSDSESKGLEGDEDVPGLGDDVKDMAGEGSDEAILKAKNAAMDAVVPGLGRANELRHEHKDMNKQKNDAKKAAGQETGGDASDKLEDVGDSVADVADKGTKGAIGASTAGSTGVSAGATLLAMEILLKIKAMTLALLSGVASIASAAASAIAGFVTAALGIGAVAAQAIAVALIVMAVGIPATLITVLVIGIVTTLKDDSGVNDCIPDNTLPVISDEDAEHIDSGEMEIRKQEVKDNIYSILKAHGGDDKNIAGFFGNITQESGFDPTRIETFQSEWYTIGPKKQKVIDADFSAQSTGAKMQPSGTPYHIANPLINRVGIGLQQWTDIKPKSAGFSPSLGGRNTALREYAKDAGEDWYDEALQMKFMFEADEGIRPSQIKKYFNDSFRTVDEASWSLQAGWIGNPSSHRAEREKFSREALLEFKTMTADIDYGESVLAGLGVERATGNNVASAYQEDDGCDGIVKDHYANGGGEIDGTGQVPSDLSRIPWTPDTLPASLKKYAYDPKDAGLGYGNQVGWYPGIQTGQCVGLASSYFTLIYPDWNKDGRGKVRPMGDGHTTAVGWASHYGEKVGPNPAAGSIFSDDTSINAAGGGGHTAIVQHVFANGDILVAETNISGASGDNNGEKYTWSWRLFDKERYQSQNWRFFKPSKFEPQWSKK